MLVAPDHRRWSERIVFRNSVLQSYEGKYVQFTKLGVFPGNELDR